MRKVFSILAVILAVSVTAAQAETYPSRPITIVVPFAAGGPVDTTTRIVADKMKNLLGQPVIVENVGGAAGSLAAGRVARARPDGYTLMTGIWGTHVANGAIYHLDYDVKADFTPVGLVSSNPLLIVASSKVPASDLTGLIAWLKQNPDKATVGTSGVGSVGHVAGVFFEGRTETHLRFIPYRGLAPAMQDLIAGNINLMFDTPATSLPQVKAGTIKAFAVTATQRLPAAPNIPTVDEAGLTGLQVSTWTAFFGPKGLDPAIVKKLSTAAMEALKDPTVRRRLADVGQEVYPASEQTPEYLADYQGKEIAKWWPIIKKANIKVQ